MISQEQLKAVLHYEPTTGVFTWLSDGTVAGGRREKDSYFRICIGAERRYSHRLAFIYMTGSCPQFVDHIDQDKGNNAWCNLRPASKSENGRNRKKNRTNKSGYKGVYYQANGFVAEVFLHGEKIYLGRFKSAELAAQAAQEARIKYHGEFAAA